MEKALNRMKKKKSSGVDGLGQDQLVMGTPVISEALTNICNLSISEGQFSQAWKEALVTPVLKKGCSKMKENYRPVSCLPAASKLLEMLVCDQTTLFMETNKHVHLIHHITCIQRSIEHYNYNFLIYKSLT